MDLGSVMKHGFNNLFNFSGREGKKQFLAFFLITFISLFLFSSLFFLEDAVNGTKAIEAANKMQTNTYGPNNWQAYERQRERRNEIQFSGGVAIAKFVFLGLVLPILLNISSMVRRVHDFGFSGKWLAVGGLVSLLVWFILPIALIVVLAVMKSDEGPNQFGEPT